MFHAHRIRADGGQPHVDVSDCFFGGGGQARKNIWIEIGL
jgi:hypothetical protein